MPAIFFLGATTTSRHTLIGVHRSRGWPRIFPPPATETLFQKIRRGVVLVVSARIGFRPTICLPSRPPFFFSVSPTPFLPDWGPFFYCRVCEGPSAPAIVAVMFVPPCRLSSIPLLSPATGTPRCSRYLIDPAPRSIHLGFPF